MDFGISTDFDVISKKIETTLEEKRSIIDKVTLKLIDTQFTIIKLAALGNIGTALLIVQSIYNFTDKLYLFSWFALLATINILNFCFSFYYSYCKPSAQNIKSWLYQYRICIALASLAWAMLLYTVVIRDIPHYFFVLFVFFGVTAGFAFGTITDFFSSALSLTILLSLSAGWSFYHGINSNFTIANDPYLYIYTAIALTIYALFLIPVTYVCNYFLRSAITNNEINAYLAIKLEDSNINLEKKIEERTKDIEYNAKHDPLTGLPNERYFDVYLLNTINNAKKNNTSFGVFFLSLNRMSRIIESFGHNYADKIIIEVAQRLKEKSTNYNGQNNRLLIANTRRDVFAIILSPLQKGGAIKEAENFLSIFNIPFNIEDKSKYLIASIGITLFPYDGDTAEILLKNADAAMFRAQAVGGDNNIVNYHADLCKHTIKSVEIENHLYSALKNNEFILNYQPIINIKERKVYGVEALIRWKHPELGLISPLDFIPIAEETGLIIPIGEWVIREACEQAKILSNLGYSDLNMAINISGKQLEQEKFTKIIYNILETIAFRSINIEIELTETVMLNETVLPVLNELKKLGVKLAIDDFGTKYSGLNYIEKFPISKLKIDKSFIDKIDDEDVRNKTVLTMIFDMANALKINVVAEGVEYKSQYTFLKQKGCDLIQGYYFSKPLSIEELKQFLESKSYLSKL